MIARAALLALACTACWTSKPQPPPIARADEPGPGPARDAGVTGATSHAPPATPCPPAYGSTDPCTPGEPQRITVRQRTDVGQGPGPAEDVSTFDWPRCSYPQGTCACQQGPSTCVGGAHVAPPPPGWQPPPYRWECTAAVRADGCPGVAPRGGEPCTITHACGYCITRVTCDHGKWSIPIVGPPAP